MDLVRVQVEVLYPGCKIAGQTTVPLYIDPPRPFFSRPKLKWKLGNTMDTIVIQDQAARLHFQSMGTSMDMVTLGDLDFLLTLKTEEELFDPWIEQFIELAVREGEETAENYRKWCRICVFCVVIETETIRFAGWLPEGDELLRVLSPGTPSIK